MIKRIRCRFLQLRNNMGRGRLIGIALSQIDYIPSFGRLRIRFGDQLGEKLRRQARHPVLPG